MARVIFAECCFTCISTISQYKGLNKYLCVCVCVCVCVCTRARAWLLSRVGLFATSWTVAHQDPLSMGFSRQEYWSGLPCSPPGDVPDLWIFTTHVSCISSIGWWILYHWSHLGGPKYLCSKCWNEWTISDISMYKNGNIILYYPLSTESNNQCIDPMILVLMSV